MQTSILRILAVMVLSSVAPIWAADQPAPAPTEAAPTKSTYLVIYRPGPAWPAGAKLKDLPLKEHGRYMIELYKQGVMKMAGGFTDDSGGAFVFEAASLEEAQAVVAADPAVTSKLFVGELKPWRLQDWDRVIRNQQQGAR